MRGRITLVQAVALTVAALSAVFLGLNVGVFYSIQKSIIANSKELRSAASVRATKGVEAYLGQGSETVEQLEQELRGGICTSGTPDGVEPCLIAELLRSANMTEISFTHAQRIGFEEAEGVRPVSKLGPEGRWQLAAFRRRTPDGPRICMRRVEQTASGFTHRERCAVPGASCAFADPWSDPESAEDPTANNYFESPAVESLSGTTILSGIAWSDLDPTLPVFNTLRAIEDAQHGLIGVARVSFTADEIDHQLLAMRVNEADPQNDPHRIFLADDEGRLVTRFNPAEPLQLSGDELRAAIASAPPEVAAALAQPAIREAEDGPASTSFEVGGKTYFLEARRVQKSPEAWRVVIVGPEDYYLASMRQTRNRWLTVSAVVIAIALLGTLWVLRAVRRRLSGIGSRLDQMREFNFSPTAGKSAFKDLNDVTDTLERAKTALRALEKYAPMQLVRELYASNRDPALGGRLQEVCVMFTDIKDFTQLSERLTADRLAQLLGRYLEVMTRAIHAHEGTVDKYIGDAVMALWNAVRPCEDAAAKACRAALDCDESARALCASPDWNAPALTTRFGIHFAEVMVGHFGAPDRMSFTAVGDGVNLASRLEGLNKQYGTHILVSASVRERCGAAFAFRRLDRVAVKGKREGVEIYELLGAAQSARPPAVDAYEAALEAYWRRNFPVALERLGGHSDDPPSRVLEARCRALLASPPPAEWDGTHFAMEK